MFEIQSQRWNHSQNINWSIYPWTSSHIRRLFRPFLLSWLLLLPRESERKQIAVAADERRAVQKSRAKRVWEGTKARGGLCGLFCGNWFFRFTKRGVSLHLGLSKSRSFTEKNKHALAWDAQFSLKTKAKWFVRSTDSATTAMTMVDDYWVEDGNARFSVSLVRLLLFVDGSKRQSANADRQQKWCSKRNGRTDSWQLMKTCFDVK